MKKSKPEKNPTLFFIVVLVLLMKLGLFGFIMWKEIKELSYELIAEGGFFLLTVIVFLKASRTFPNMVQSNQTPLYVH